MADEVPEKIAIPFPTIPPWQPPLYAAVMIRPGYEDSLCTRCGTLVIDVLGHNKHHRGIDQLKDALVALTAILVPGIPPGTLLAQFDTAFDVGEFIRSSSDLGGQGSSATIKVTGGTGGEGAVGVSGGIIVGRGGGGNDPDIPECPGCGAYGGGGHGGGCRNSNRPVSMWS